MNKFLSSKALVRTLTAVVVFVSTVNASLRGRLPDSAIISNVVKEQARPFVKSFDTVPEHQNKKLRKLIKGDVERVIKKKIRQLKPELDEQVELFSGPEDDEETSIIEFSPFPGSHVRDENSPRPEKVKDAIHKYKKLRREIGNMLKKEPVSVQTKYLVTKTLDRLISQMISSQCNLPTDVRNVPVNRAQGSLLKVDKAEMLKSWTKKWQELIKQYTIGSQDSDMVGAGYKEMFLFLIRLREFFFEIHDELNMLNDRYMVKCQLTEKNPKKKSGVSKDLRTRTKNRQDECKYIKICSDELKAFMIDFYMKLKNTVEVVFKNYVEMYKRDITTDTSQEKRSFTKMINNINDIVIEKMDKSFQRETIKLDMRQYNSTKDKYNILIKFVETTVDNIQRISKKVLSTHLKPLEVKLRSTVTQDLLTSIGIELNNFQTEQSERMCSVFQTCNGNSTRRMHSGRKDSFTFGRNNINVKLKIGFEDLGSIRKSLNGGKKRRVFDGTGNRHQRSNPKPPFDLSKYAHIKVTRTKHTTKTEQKRTSKPTKPTTAKTTTTTTPTITRTTSKLTTQSPSTTAIVAKKTTYTYADHVKEMIILGKIKTPLTSVSTTTNTTDPTTTLSYLDFIKKMKAEGKIAGPDIIKPHRNSNNNVLTLLEF